MEDFVNYILSKNYLTKDNNEYDCFQIAMCMVNGNIKAVKKIAHQVYLRLQNN